MENAPAAHKDKRRSMPEKPNRQVLWAARIYYAVLALLLILGVAYLLLPTQIGAAPFVYVPGFWPVYSALIGAAFVSGGLYALSRPDIVRGLLAFVLMSVAIVAGLALLSPTMQNVQTDASLTHASQTYHLVTDLDASSAGQIRRYVLACDSLGLMCVVEAQGPMSWAVGLGVAGDGLVALRAAGGDLRPLSE